MEIHYKGLFGKILFSAELNVFYGEILSDLPEGVLIAFQGQTVDLAIKALEDAVDRYLSSTFTHT